MAALAAILGARAEPAEALSCATPPGGPPTEREQIQAADVVVEAVALSGPRTAGLLHSPARMAVLRYLKGRGPRVLRAQTGIDPSLGGDYLGVSTGGTNAGPGQRWRLFIHLPRDRRRVRRGEVVVPNLCGGTRMLRNPFRDIPGIVTARSGRGAAWRLVAQRGPQRVRCLTARRTDRKTGRGDTPANRRACERIAPQSRSAVLTVEHHSEGSPTASTLVAASGPRLRMIEVQTPEGTVVERALGRGRLAAVALDGYLPEASLPVTLRLAGGRTVHSQADAAFRVRADDPEGDAPWTGRTLRQLGRSCAEFRQLTPRFGRPQDWLGGGGSCGTVARDGIFFGVIRPNPLAPDTRTTRTVLIGAAGPSVESVTVRSPSGDRGLPLAQRGRAFLSVHPASVDHADLTVEVLYRNGGRATFSGRRRVR